MAVMAAYEQTKEASNQKANKKYYLSSRLNVSTWQLPNDCKSPVIILGSEMPHALLT